MSEQKQQAIFTNGLFFQRREKAPEYVVGGLSVKVIDFTKFLEKHQNNAGYVNIDIKQSRGGKYYCELNQYKPSDVKKDTAVNEKQIGQVGTDDVVDTLEYPNKNINLEDVPF